MHSALNYYTMSKYVIIHIRAETFSGILFNHLTHGQTVLSEAVFNKSVRPEISRIFTR